jgi:hypothetical protein
VGGVAVQAGEPVGATRKVRICVFCVRSVLVVVMVIVSVRALVPPKVAQLNCRR